MLRLRWTLHFRIVENRSSSASVWLLSYATALMWCNHSRTCAWSACVAEATTVIAVCAGQAGAFFVAVADLAILQAREWWEAR